MPLKGEYYGSDDLAPRMPVIRLVRIDEEFFHELVRREIEQGVIGCAVAHELVDGFVADATIADKGYDADHLCDRIAETGSEVVIPPKRNRTDQRPYDADLYKERNIIERFFNRLKQFRRVATRYDKLLANFMGFVKLAAIAIWLK